MYQIWGSNQECVVLHVFVVSRANIVLIELLLKFFNLNFMNFECISQSGEVYMAKFVWASACSVPSATKAIHGACFKSHHFI